MAYKDLLLGLDDGARTRERLDLAARLAESFAAHLVGLYATVAAGGAPAAAAFEGVSFAAVTQVLEQERRDAAESVRRLFEDTAGRHGLSAEWRSASGVPSQLAAVHGRYADLIVLGQLDPDEDASQIRPRPEEVAFLSGRPVLIVPYAGTFAAIGRRVLVGWDGSREATRAVNDAMPLLARAASVTVVTVDAKIGATRHGEVPGADIALHLARHGVTAAVERLTSGGIDIGNVLLSRAADLEADLLVNGAYGHSRFREQLLGGTTRTILASMSLPVLIAH